MYKPLRIAYLRCSQGFIKFLMTGKFIDFVCVLREYGLAAELSSPMKYSFALKVQPFSERCLSGTRQLKSLPWIELL